MKKQLAVSPVRQDLVKKRLAVSPVEDLVTNQTVSVAFQYDHIFINDHIERTMIKLRPDI